MKMRVALSVLILCSLLDFTAALAQWQPNGVGITALGQSGASFAVSDGGGGAIVAWTDTRNGDDDIYIQRVNASGVPQWKANGVAVTTAVYDQFVFGIVSDGAGGAIVAWTDGRSNVDYDVYIQRVNASGVPQWTADGVALSTAAGNQEGYAMVSDGAGGAIVVWRDERSGLASVHPYVQRINASGVAQWTANGLAVTMAANNQTSARIVADGSGGAIVVWVDSRAGNADIYAQRLNASGVALWTADGSAVCTISGNQFFPMLVTDGTGGAIIAWQDPRNGNQDIYANRMDASGARQWGGPGVAVSIASGDQTHPGLATDGGGGAFVTWSDFRNGPDSDIYAQRIDASGSSQWALNGVAVCNAINGQAGGLVPPAIIPDGAGNAIIAWADGRGPDVDIYAQRVVASGGGSWTFNGVPVCTAIAEQNGPVLVSDGAGSAIVSWGDGRKQCQDCSDIYAQRIEFKYGYWGHPDAVVNYVTDMPLDQGGKMMMEWQASQLDNAASEEIDQYQVWVQGPYPHPWVEVGTVSPTGQATYSMEVSTFADATPGDRAIHHFKVIAHSIPTLGYDWESNVVDGSSVDNLAPSAPTSLSAERLPTGGVLLHWHGVSAPDLSNYAIYRWKQPGPQQFLMSSEDTTAIDATASNDELHYTVGARDVHGNESPQSNEAVAGMVTGVGDTPALSALTVLQNHPNPFSQSTVFDIGLAKSSDVRVDIFDVAGRRVSVLTLNGARAGWNRIPFAARDDHNQPLANGVYFYRVKQGGEIITRKMVIAR